MLTLAQVNELAGVMVANDLDTLEVKGATYAVRMVRAPGAPSAGVARTLTPTPLKALSPATGSFEPRGADDGLPALRTGAQVQANEPLGYIGIGPFRVLCVSPAAGRVIGALPAPNATITQGDPLFTIEPAP